jgi:RNA polymerase sigma-54 factor
MKLRLDLKLSQKLIMTPQLQQAIKLLQLSRLELQQSLTQHLLENPLLDEVQSDVEEGESSVSEGKAEEGVMPAGQEQSVQDESREERGAPEEFSASGWEEYIGRDRRGGDSEYAATQDDLPSYEQTVAKPTSLEEHLLWQLSLSTLTDREKTAGRLIIGNLDDDGYLRMSLAEVIAGTDFTESEAESVLKDVQTFDPTGVAARDLPECLLLQLRHLGRNPFGSLGAPPGALKGSVIEAIVLHHLKDLERRQYAKVAKALNVTVEDVFHATKVIGELEPKPGRPFINTQNYVIVPDVFVVKNEGEWVVLLNDDGLPRMRISPYYKQLISSGQNGTPETKAYMDEKMRAAQWVIRSIEQRNRTIVKVVSSIVKFQE